MYYLKGAPERVLRQCKYWGGTLSENEFDDADFSRVAERSKEMGSRGLRGEIVKQRDY